MEHTLSFGEVLEAADGLSGDEQEDLIAILRRRLIERRRDRIAAEVVQARRELKAGECKPTTPQDLIAEILT